MSGKLCRRRRAQRRRRAVKALLAHLRWAGACQVCGEGDPLVLDFHHVDPASKAFSLGGRCRRSMTAVRAELRKTALVCANCHRRINARAVDGSGLIPLELPDAVAPTSAS